MADEYFTLHDPKRATVTAEGVIVVDIPRPHSTMTFTGGSGSVVLKVEVCHMDTVSMSEAIMSLGEAAANEIVKLRREIQELRASD